MKPTTKNIVLGAGYIFFDELDANGNLTGERYLAETPGFALSVTSETLEEWGSDGPIAEKIADIATRVNREASLTCKDVKGEHLAIFVIADVSTKSTTTGAVTDSPINGGRGVKQGRWYQLGVSTDLPTGVRNISAVVIKDAVPTTYVLGTDYELDAETARLYIVPGGGIADDTVITADFTKADTSWEQITSNDLGAKRGALRYIADNTTGENRDAYLPDVVMKPDGEFAFKSRETVQQMGFKLGINRPADGRAALYINGRPV